jgi:LysR family glycine cleavage system transcriptional activator
MRLEPPERADLRQDEHAMSPPRELPSTASLRAFTRAARTLSFKRAAAELHVSASALSRQIQALEDHLGVRLFQRLNPGLALTDEGRRYLEASDAALSQLEAAQDLLSPHPRPLRVSALESFSETTACSRSRASSTGACSRT